ncbi:MAG: deoxyribose-phosphate aldolase [Oscillospiraceae bacterium]|nr:deoxyribose-phosphate aldolase [Candidatus Limimonas coprohippi]MCQ2487985.1 deoxyribose-phosphate aldolase [Clostridia bacterium]
MDINDILSKVDHTLLAVDATWDDIKVICDDAIKYHTASVCVPQSYVKQCADYLNKRVPVCTVIGFPNGYNSTASKCYEAYEAVRQGADEIDMVINVGWLKDKRYDDILNEINDIKGHCCGKLLKVIVETCLLTDDEIVKITEIVNESNADFIKTSTGFSKAGATFHDIELFKKTIDEKHGSTRIKAAGGISSIEDAEKFLALGADRLGTSRIVKIVKSEGLL